MLSRRAVQTRVISNDDSLRAFIRHAIDLRLFPLQQILRGQDRLNEAMAVILWDGHSQSLPERVDRGSSVRQVPTRSCCNGGHVRPTGWIETRPTASHYVGAGRLV